MNIQQKLDKKAIIVHSYISNTTSIICLGAFVAKDYNSGFEHTRDFLGFSSALTLFNAVYIFNKNADDLDIEDENNKNYAKFLAFSGLVLSAGSFAFNTFPPRVNSVEAKILIHTVNFAGLYLAKKAFEISNTENEDSIGF